ncbi:non-ribosomal peptide synthetase [Hazenella coriacea]|uniref:Polyketide synthase PksJ n=1 Tax=Hazenella coriacea TaxID=1179467 RepID=A0A4R3L3Y1_9BACL|nr:non-ribosomal peptide synthetase [Hazenella coriacea]TCS93648.1 polyketide synthase PksJ [Hazenella coriacea]
MKDAFNANGSTNPSISHGGLLLRTEDQPTIIPEILHRTAMKYGDSKGIIYLQSDGSEIHQSYAQLWDDARRLLGGFRQAGLGPQDTVIFQLADNEHILPAFWGCELAGIVPVPLAVAPTYTQPSSATQKLEDAWTVLDHPPVITSRDMLPELKEWAKAQGLESFQILVIEDLLASEIETDWHHAQPEDLALLLLTSGSTGKPKAVMLNHHNVLSMITGMIQMFRFTSQDVTFNWMPFDHIGGIGMMHMRSVLLGCQEINTATQTILVDPLRWLDWIDHYRATVTWAPNFAFGLLTDYSDEIKRQNWDLSSMRFMLNGGEAMVARVGRTVLEMLEPHGLPANAIHPAWGMSETSSGVIFSDNFMRTTTSDEDEFVEIGHPIPGFSMRIVDENDQVVPEGSIGRLQVSGYSVTSGYYRQPELNQSVFTKDRWFETGDLGYLRQGNLTITGRSKDSIIINGINYYSHAIESAVEELSGIETSYTAACAVRGKGDTTDQLAIFFVRSHTLDDLQIAQLLREIRSHVTQTVGVSPEYLLPVEKEGIPKTAIGKIQRAQLKKEFENGDFSGLLKEMDMVMRGAKGATVGRQTPNKDAVKLKEEDIQKDLIQFFIENLNISHDWIEPDTQIHSLGVNSILMMKLIRIVEKSYRIKITTRDLFKYATIQSLANYIAEQANLSISSRNKQVAVVSTNIHKKTSEKQSFQSPLSEVQKGLWALQKMSPETSAYNIPLGFRFTSKLEIEKLKQSLQIVLKQHPILTSVIEDKNGMPYIKTQSPQSLIFLEEDISTFAEDEVLPYFRKKVKEPFDLEQDPLMRTYLFSRSQKEHYLLLVVHHLIFDGISSMTFIQSLLEAYEHLLEGKLLNGSPISMDYDELVEWEQDMLSSEEGEMYRSYWKQQLSGTLPILQLPTDRSGHSDLSFEGQTYTRSLSTKFVDQLKSFAQKYSMSVSTVLLGSYMVLLNRYSGQEDLIVGMPVMVRPEERFDQLIGHYLNMIPIRSRIPETGSFLEFVNQLQLTVLDGLDHAPYPFTRMIRDLNIPRNQVGFPIFQTAFYYQNFLQSTSYKKMLSQYENTVSVDFVEGIHQEGEFELVFELWDEEDGMDLHIKYSSDLFDIPTIESMYERYIHLVEAMIQSPDMSMKEYSMIPEEELNTILHTWNATQEEYPTACFHELFEQQVNKTPEATAVVYEHKSFTYRELNERSSLLAIYLQDQGVGPDTLVGICVERSLDMIVGLLGILKAGAAYVPLDPNYPDERLAHIFEDSGTPIVLTQSQLRNKFDRLNEKRTKVILLDQDWDQIVRRANESNMLKREVRPDHLAYVIYTSGSTGKPKGVMIPHQALTNFLVSMAQSPGLQAKDRVLALTTYCFDIAGLELFLPLIVGAQCYICGTEQARNVEQLKLEIQNIKPTMIQATPVTWTMLFQSGWKNEEGVKILCGGEALPPKLKQNFISTGSEAWNMYGPTETTIWSTIQRIQEGEPITIGKPIANTYVYIVDQQLKPVPVGHVGELCIAGEGLARGYYNQSVLTAEKFIDNPFRPETKLYKTGDLARWLPKGQIEYLGRIDNQVKIRGFRIELGAIENRIGQHPEVQETVTIVKQHNGNKKLVAYFTSNDAKTSPSLQELRDYVRSNLPDYMVPSHFIRLDQMPLTPNGKVDRKELESRQLIQERTAQKSLPPSRVEETILKIWEEVLEIGNIGMEDRFFDVGGDSVLAVSVVERIKKELSFELSVTELFEYPNIKAISSYIVDQKGNKLTDSIKLDQELENRESNQGQRDHTQKDWANVLPDYYQDSLAIIGISCQFPGAKNHLEFWNNIREGKESVKFFTTEELRDLNMPEELIENSNYVPVQSSIEGKDLFDPGFFNLSPKDAEFMDPQLRLLLLHSWKAMEDAGYVSKQIPETSVYMSASNNSYRAFLPHESTKNIETPDGYVSWVLAQSGTIPTMISHKLGLKGPSYFVHSNCSSSLVGLYSAYQSLQSGEAKYALVGGTTLHTGSNVGYVHQAGLNFSSDGHVKAFDASADGMIGGEGVAVILLKKAVDAVNDGDHIYALLRGIGINNDGADKVGFYAPSVKGQAEVIQKVLDFTQIHPESISYVEAHGTGTKLGDPIEFTALNSVYTQYTNKKQFCGIGSVKTNIGHMDTAAGLAGCIKVAMSLYHNELAPSINYKEPNPNIDLVNSPFYVVNERKELEKSSSAPRAALSSFGLGGTNTHAILEQYRDMETKTSLSKQTEDNRLYLIPVSAKNKDRLKAYVQELLTFLNYYEWENHTIADLAYTFQIGREAMDSRVAFVAEDVDQLKQQLESYIQGNQQIEDIVRGEKKQAKDVSWLEEDEDSKELIRTWISKGKLRKLAELWSKGLMIDWELLHQDVKPRRMSLPTYPFAEEHFSIPQFETIVDSHMTSVQAREIILHPLLHQNTSDLSEQRFTSTFTGQEFFLADHVVRGKSVLPGVAYLEMAHSAVNQATGIWQDENTKIKLQHVVWVQPIVADQQPVQVHIGLFPEDNGKIAYEIYSNAENESDPVVHSQGSAELISRVESQVWNLTDLQEQCNQSMLSPDQFYEEARSRGLTHGSRFQGIKKVYVGQEEVLAKLVLPASISETKDDYVLHPSMMDSAVQTATICIMLGLDQQNLMLPFALEEIEVIGKCTSYMWAYARFSKGNKVGDAVQKVDIDLCDDTGLVCVRIKGFSTRVLDGEVPLRESLSKTESLLLEPIWKEQVVVSEIEAPEYVEHMVFLCEGVKVAHESISSRMEDVRVVTLDEAGTPDKRFQTYAEQIFEYIQGAFQSRLQGNVLIQVVVSKQNEQQLFAGLTGLLKTARLENSKLIGQLIEIGNDEDAESLIEKLKDNRLSPSDNHIRYVDGKRYVADWCEMMAVKDDDGNIPWKDNGIYLITGGAGSLGLLFAKEIAHRAQHVGLILTGRSTLRTDQERQLEILRDMGARVTYKQMNMTNQEAVYQLIQEIREEYGHLNGIIHGAGIIKDNFMVKKTRDEFQEVMAPKVAGLVNLDEASKDLKLDFFMLFSSISGSLGNAGQADYAAANTFMDVYAEYRNTLTISKQRYGKTLSINWPLWRDGGMRVDEEIEKMLLQNLGMIPLEKENGIKALYQAFASGENQVFVIEGHVNKIKQKLSFASNLKTQQQDDHGVQESSTNMEAESLFDKILESLKQMASNILKVESQDIHEDTELGEYGFDSISFTVFANQMNQVYQLEVTPTIFFEHATLKSLIESLITDYQSKLLEKFAMPSAVPKATTENKPIEPTVAKRRNRFNKVAIKQEETNKVDDFEPIAIIGISGKFPGANDIDEFWGNLAEGKDSITEVPKDRWDWQEHYGDPANDANKTNIKWGGFIDGVAEFDPLFFGISPREAQFIDPQQRLLMTYAWKAIEDAGYSAQGLSGTKTGVFIGTGNTGYKDLFYQANLPIEGHSTTGNMIPSVGPNRMSYFLNIHGPSEPIETACSSSLVAIHRAVSAMRDGSCDMAIVGGVNTILTPEAHISYSKAGMLSIDGRCKTFSNHADGYVRSEGVGMIMLKRLKDAELDMDHIYGVIRGTAENHGGRANTLTSPNPKAQADLLVTAYKKAGIDPRTVTYIEAHGTGTELGDPIEINGLKAAFKELYQLTGDSEVMDHYCGLGSVKSNIGHLELAAGISSVIKVLLQMKHKTLVKSLHCETLNPYIQLQDSPFYIVQDKAEWKAVHDQKGKELPRRAGVSSFGIGGVNAHIVIEEYVPKGEEPPTPTVTAQNPALIVLSAKNEKRLREQVEQLLVAIRERKYSDLDLVRMAYTLQVGREGMEERLAVIVGTMMELEEKLIAFIEGKEHIEDLYRGQANRNKETLAIFTADEDMARAIDAWISKRKYAKLVDLWVKGLNIDWNQLYGDVKPRRLSLPTYPFAKEHYWIPENSLRSQDNKQRVIENADVSLPEELTKKRTTCFLTKQWEPSPSVSRKKGTRQTVAILANQETMKLAVELSRYFPQHQILDQQNMGLQPSKYDWTSFDGFVDLIGCGKNTDESLEWMDWLQKLIEYGHKEGLMLLCVTQGLESYLNPSMNLVGATRTGLYRMLQSEYSHLRSRHMDTDASISDQELAQQIVEEFYSDHEDPEVCYRKGIRYRSFLKQHLGSEEEVNPTPEGFPEGHVLLITGGTRGLGSLCAKHFVQNYGVKRLVLTGRESLPPRDQWNQFKHLNTSIGQKIRAVQELEAQGAQVEVWSLRLSDPTAVQRSLQDIKQRMGPIGGVIHCAGMTDMETLAFIRKEAEEIQEVLEPKIAGLNTLSHLLSDEPLQFFVLFSSVSAIIPFLSAGQGDYAMANAYMDYFAEANKGNHPIVSIQWPNWKETGMGEVTNKVYRESGLLSITNAEGLSLFDQILARKLRSVVMPAVADSALWNPEQLLRRTQHQVASIVEVEKKGEKLLDVSTENNTSKDLLEETQAWLITLFSEELKIDSSQLVVNEPFQDYGVDSIILAQLLQRMNRKLMISLDPSILYEYPTIELFATWLMRTYTSSLANIFAHSALEEVGATVSTVEERPAPTQLSESPVSVQVRETDEPSPLSSYEEDIAVVGLSCRFPGARTLEAYWELLSEGRSAIRSVPPERWGYTSQYYAGLIDHMTHFDPAFFLLHEEDVKVMDPQALVVLEECLKLWYHAGYTHEEIKGKSIGVYLGGRSHHKPSDTSLLHARNPIIAVGQNYLAANISHFFDVRGPSVVLDTACSSAVVGMNMAIQALHSRDIEAAVVGGVSLLETDETHRLFQQRGILCKEPSFHVFDERADGVVLGEGVGMVLLKTVKQALQDGDSIYAVIKATAINNDGRTAGPATPNLQAQKDVMQKALLKSGKQPEEISYIEANGSGSMVTDLLELKAIQSIYRFESTNPLGLGSIKPNIGHPICAEGIASFIKVVLMLQHRRFVPFLSGEEVMTHFDRKAANISFSRELAEWTARVPVAGINCFADGGTNAHVIVEAWEETGRTVKRFPLSPPELKKRSFSQNDARLLTKRSEGHELQMGKVNIWDTYDVEV